MTQNLKVREQLTKEIELFNKLNDYSVRLARWGIELNLQFIKDLRTGLAELYNKSVANLKVMEEQVAKLQAEYNAIAAKLKIVQDQQEALIMKGQWKYSKQGQKAQSDSPSQNSGGGS